jgi:hypothetical protein
MSMLYSSTAAGALLGLCLALAPAPDQASTPLDLQPKANHKLKEEFHNATLMGNHLGSLPTGKQRFAEVPFTVGEALIQLGSTQVAGMPKKVEGIPVGRPFAKLRVLHACGHKADEDYVIGSYLVRYADESTEKIDVVYGKDVRDWWYADGDLEPTRAKVAWKGDNDAAKGLNSKIRLYLMTWENPKPDKKVVSIDLISADESPAALFCVAMTVEGK